jgi:hypothetical protein
VIPFNSNFRLFHGSDWFALNQKTLDRLFELDPVNHPVVRFFVDHFPAHENQFPCPQEIVIQSLVGNLEGLLRGGRNCHFIDWTGSTDWHPRILNLGHWDDIQKSGALWARKFDVIQSTELLKKLHDEILDSNP